jgi:hypothetical protein
VTILTLPASPVNPSPDEVLAPPCTCMDCPQCDDTRVAALAEALALVEDDGPDLVQARAEWATISGPEFDRRQVLLAQYYQDGRRHALGGCQPTVAQSFGDDELADAFVRGWEHGADELEVDEAIAARDRLPLDERADEAVAMDRYERGLLA